MALSTANRPIIAVPLTVESMAKSQMGELSPILRQLQRSLKTAERSVKTVVELLKSCEGTISTISQITEQLASCQRVDFNDTPFQEHPSWKQKLEAKLIMSIENSLYTLQSCIDSLCEMSSKLSKSVDDTAELVLFSGIDIANAHPSVLWPPISEMYAWVKDLDVAVFTTAVEKKFLLENLSYTDVSSLSLLSERWTDSRLLLKKRELLTHQIQVFLGEDLSGS